MHSAKRPDLPHTARVCVTTGSATGRLVGPVGAGDWDAGVVVGGARHHRSMTTRSFTITPVGEFSLAQSALFGFGQRMRPAGVGERELQFDGVMRLVFCLDGYHDQVGVELRQGERVVHAVVHGPGELDAIQRQVARVLSLGHVPSSDARRFPGHRLDGHTSWGQRGEVRKQS